MTLLHPLAFAAALAAALAATTTPALAADDELPGWYQWYAKAGGMTRIEPEAARDADMGSPAEVARWSPEVLDVPSPELSLPDGTGVPVSLRGHVGARWRVIQPFQAWW